MLSAMRFSEAPQPISFQHGGQKITQLACGGILLSNPNKIRKITSYRQITISATPCVANADLSALRLDVEQCEKAAFQSAVGTLGFTADHPAISWITGVLGRHLHDPSPRHVAALKPIHRYLNSRASQGPRYTARGPLHLFC